MYVCMCVCVFVCAVLTISEIGIQDRPRVEGYWRAFDTSSDGKLQCKVSIHPHLFFAFPFCQCYVIDVDADERSHELGVHEIFAQEFLVGMAIRMTGSTEDKLKQCFHAYVLVWYPLCSVVNARMVRAQVVSLAFSSHMRRVCCHY